MLAHDDRRAKRWLKDQTYVPQNHVDQWTGEGLGFDDETVKSFRRAYGEFSAFAHPSARAALTTAEEKDGTLRFSVESKVKLDVAASALLEIETVAVYACFALRNATVSEEAINPAWRQALYQFAQQTLGTDLPHLERDWQSEEEAFTRLSQRVREAAELDHELRTNPSSWHNLRESQ